MKAKLLAVALMTGVAFAYAGEPSKGKDAKASASDHKGHVMHKAVGVVKKVDTKAAMATIEHEAVKSANMPAMTMDFKVQDKAALAKLTAGKKVEFEFEERGKDYIIHTVK
jgi:Cu(I)/Ag(I) efflux system protein CusF